MTSKDYRASRAWAASIEQSRQQVIADRMASIAHSRYAAAYDMLCLLPEKTPDGAPYSVSSIRAAMVGM